MQQAGRMTLQMEGASGRTTRVPAVRLTGVTKDFGSVHAVRGIDLSSSRARSSPSSAPTAPARPPPSTWCSGSRSRRPARSRCSACQPRQAIARGLVVRGDADRRAAQGPHGARDRASTPPACSPTPGRSTRCWRSAGIAGIADRKVGKCSGRRAAAAAVRDGAAVRPGPAAARRADHRHGRRGTPRLLVGDPRGRRAGPHRAVRDALPRGGRPVRRPDHADQQRPDRRRRHRQRRSRRSPPAARSGPPCAGPTPRRCRSLGRASSSVEVRGDAVLRARQGHRRGRALPAHRRPTPTTWRSPPAGSRTRSSASPATTTTTTDQRRHRRRSLR